MSNRILFAALGTAVTAGLALVAVLNGWGPTGDQPEAPQDTALVTPVQDDAPKAPAANPPVETAPKPADPVDPPAPEPDEQAEIAEPSAPETVDQADPADPLSETVERTALPSFDIVRTEPDGNTLVAGQGLAGAALEVLVNGAPEAETDVGSDGKFVTFLDVADATGPAVLTLRMTHDGKVTLSDSEVIIAPSAPAVADLPEGTSDAADGKVAPDTQTADAPEVADATPEPTNPAPPETAELTGPDAPVQTEAADPPGAAAPVGLAGTGAVTAPEALAALPGAPNAPNVALPGQGDAATNPANAEGQVAISPAATPQPLDGVRAAAGDPDDVVASADAPEAAGSPASQAAPITPEASEAAEIARAEPARASAPADAPRTPTVLLSGPRGIEVLQIAPLSPGDVALDSISYDDAGEVLLAGRGEGDGFVRIYLDNKPVTTSRIREDGRWKLELPQVDTGTYTLRVDQLNAAGEVTARVESPFLRESAEVLEAATAGKGPITSITVQPGNTLWGISRERYGDGLEYFKVFEANRDRIRDPDLIYPGQIFDLPLEAADKGE